MKPRTFKEIEADYPREVDEDPLVWWKRVQSHLRDEAEKRRWSEGGLAVTPDGRTFLDFDALVSPAGGGDRRRIT